MGRLDEGVFRGECGRSRCDSVADESPARADALHDADVGRSADHGAAATGLGFANLGVARFQHFSLGKLRFSFAE